MKSSVGNSESPDWLRSRPLRWMAVVFGCFHGSMLLVSLAPFYSPPHSTLLPVLTPYHELTGTRQDWDMFQTIPETFSMSARMKMESADGTISLVGPILPDLETFQTPKSIRYFCAISRILHGRNELNYRKGWDRLIARKVEDMGGVSYEVEIEEQLTRNFFYIKRDGQLTKTFYTRFGSPSRSPGDE